MGLTPGSAEPPHKTFAITVAYDGTEFAGWQVQPDLRTVQGELERAASELNGEPARVLGAGRTDAGVHARGQVARVATGRAIEADRLPAALNARLPDDVVVRAAREVPSGFHSIRDAAWKLYRYTMYTADPPDPLERRYALFVTPRPELAPMRAAAACLTGTHDFGPFGKTGSPRSTTVRTVRSLDVQEAGDYIRIDIIGNGFLYGMARNLAGTLLRAGQGSLDPEAIPSALQAGNRGIAGPCLPAHGLCLMEVIYTEEGT